MSDYYIDSHRPIRRPLEGLANSPSTEQELQTMRAMYELNSVFRRLEPVIAFLGVAGLWYVCWKALPILANAMGAL